jgi:hypothetical protein
VTVVKVFRERRVTKSVTPSKPLGSNRTFNVYVPSPQLAFSRRRERTRSLPRRDEKPWGSYYARSHEYSWRWRNWLVHFSYMPFHPPFLSSLLWFLFLTSELHSIASAFQRYHHTLADSPEPHFQTAGYEFIPIDMHPHEAGIEETDLDAWTIWMLVRHDPTKTYLLIAILIFRVGRSAFPQFSVAKLDKLSRDCPPDSWQCQHSPHWLYTCFLRLLWCHIRVSCSVHSFISKL